MAKVARASRLAVQGRRKRDACATLGWQFAGYNAESLSGPFRDDRRGSA